MNLLGKVFRRGVLAASTFVLPRDSRDVRLYKGRHFDLLVCANEDIGRQLIFLGSYEKAESEYFRNHLSPADVCLDVGANVGYFSLLMASAAPRGVVHAFEPIPANAALMRASLALNNLSHVFVNECAVGASAGTVSFSESRDSAYSSMRATGRVPEARALAVPVLTLDAYLDERKISRVDVLKVDVEGAEGLVISGATALLGNPESKPRLVLMELHDPNLAPFGTNSAELLDRMRSFGYTPWVIRGAGSKLQPYDSRRHARDYNILFTV